MKRIKALAASLAFIAIVGTSARAERLAGGDISLLPEYESAGAIYKDHAGKPISELLPWLREQGMNAMRVRLFVNPELYEGADKDPNTCQDLEYIRPLCKRIKDNGFQLLLDFHYSDTWADPAKQWTPKAWENLSDAELYDKIEEYTREVLETLKADGCAPDLIQPGNEISYGMMWGPANATTGLKKTYMGSEANWPRFTTLLKRAIKACQEVCPDARIILHTERVAQPNVLANFYSQMQKYEVPYDVIGLSYYPYFHGDMGVLRTALNRMTGDFPDKDVMIVETGYSYKWEVPGTDHDLSGTWAYSDAGQDAFATDLVNLLEEYDKVDGLFWWWMEYNAYHTSLSGWYNAPLFDSTSGKATSALTTICGFAKDNGGVEEVAAEALCPGSNAVYTLSGIKVNTDRPIRKGLYVSNGAIVAY